MNCVLQDALFLWEYASKCIHTSMKNIQQGKVSNFTNKKMELTWLLPHVLALDIMFLESPSVGVFEKWILEKFNSSLVWDKSCVIEKKITLIFYAAQIFTIWCNNFLCRKVISFDWFSVIERRANLIGECADPQLHMCPKALLHSYHFYRLSSLTPARPDSSNYLIALLIHLQILNGCFHPPRRWMPHLYLLSPPLADG